jgi:DNA-binding NarL/FixJ family response regulator
MIRVALIDDHESVRLGLSAACARIGTIQVVFSGSSVRDYRMWRSAMGALPADVVVLDLTLGDGTTVTENVVQLIGDGSPVLIHSVADRPPRCARRSPPERAGSSARHPAPTTSSPRS